MRAIIQSMRPKQWIKNIFVFAPLIFSIEFVNFSSWLITILAAIAFIMVSGAVYILNDLADIQADQKNPAKKNRPIAAGELSRTTAIMAIIFLLAVGTLVASLLQPGCFFVLVIYFLINAIYSKGLKHIAILDVLVISVGFVLRVMMGGMAIGVEVSPWIIVGTFTLSLFLGFGKRRHEVRTGSIRTRASLEFYNEDFLDKLINVTCASAFLSYVIYAVTVAQQLNKTELVYTIVFVAFGIFRYLQFIYFDKEGGEPEKIIFHDRWFTGNFIVWLISIVWILA